MKEPPISNHPHPVSSTSPGAVSQAETSIGHSDQAPKTIDEVAEILLNRKASENSWKAATAKQARFTFALFSMCMKEERNKTLVDEIGQSDLEHFNDLLRKLPKSFGKSSQDASKSMAELRAEGAAKDPSDVGLDPGTRDRHLTFLGTLFALAKEHGKVDPGINTSALFERKPIRIRGERPVPVSSAMSQLFHSPVFTGCKSWDKLNEPGVEVFHRAAYWAPSGLP